MKLAAALAVPIVALLLVTGLEVVKTSRQVSEIQSQSSLARITVGPTGLITALQNERSWALVDLVGATDVVVPTEGYGETRRDVDRALERFREELSHVGRAAGEAYAPAVDGLDRLAQLRDDVDADDGPRSLDNLAFANGVFERYSELIAPFLSNGGRVAVTIDDPDLRQGVELVDTASRQVEQLSDLVWTTLVASVSDGGVDQSGEITQLAMLQSGFERNAAALRSAEGRYQVVVEEHFPAELTDGVNARVDQAIATGSVETASLLATVSVPDDQSYPGLRDQLTAAMEQRASEVNTAASNRDNWFIALAAFTLVTALALMLIVSRSITQPLRALTRQAKHMAERRLPDAVLDILETPLGDNVEVPEIEPVTVPTRDEVADVAVALNTVQETALDLAVEQAVLRRNIADSFVNLGRRNQNLLGRQLDFITELESNETDPSILASLFRLDHLATRMRRNAESLLVLAGIDPPRKWAAPVRVTDVIRAALGEVEDYQRVAIRDVEPATIIGSSAADLAHLIAEFIENALTFSPPDRSVEIRGHDQPPGQGYTLAIIDAGLGMSEADIQRANRRLAGTESFTIAPSKYLGHYVAGNLAARHDIRLHLENSPGNGVTATIEIPPTLLTSDAPPDDPITDPHASRAVPASVPLAPDLPIPALAALSGPVARTAGPGGASPVPPSNGSPGPGETPASWAARLGLTDGPGAGAIPAQVDRHGPPPGLGGPENRGPIPVAEAAPDSARTASGLVKRSPRGAAGPPAARPPAAGSPAAGPLAAGPAAADDDLLASLARHHANLRDAGQTAATLLPPLPSPPPPGAVTAPASPSPRPGPLPQRRPPAGSAPVGEPPVGLPQRRPTTPRPPATGPAATAPPGVAGTAPPAGPAAGPAASPGDVPGRPPAAGPAPASGTTAGGLTRRVRGTNLPGTDPVTVRRGEGEPRSPQGGRDRHTPDDVYGFLTSFTSGVQRGLDEAQGGAKRDGD